MAPRRLLLVGEGNFSFAAALGARCGPDAHVTATCLQAPEALADHPLAQENVRRLRHRGADVRFSVDCTRLADILDPDDSSPFDRIYFNFPHCGRKAGVARNRELLAGFFRSCVDVLAEQGEVHVALCRGQGGTPADQPQREWHNSWQVVAMAAEAGLILSQVQPFRPEAMPGYKCTGYRSQDKLFVIEGALNHIFIRGPAFGSPRPTFFRVRVDGQWLVFPVPEALVDKMDRGFLAEDSSHPIKSMKERLMAELGRAFPLRQVECPAPVTAGEPPIWNADTPSAAFWLWPIQGRSPSPEPTAGGRTLEPEEFPASSLPLPTQEGGGKPGPFLLRPSLTVHVRAVARGPGFLPGVLHELSGPVFRKSLVAPLTPPVFHQTLLVLGFPWEERDARLRALRAHLSDSLDRLFGPSGPGNARVKGSVTWQPQPEAREAAICVVSPADDPEGTRSVVIGAMGVAAGNLGPGDLGLALVTLNVDLMVMQAWGVPDWRALWPWDGRFLSRGGPGQADPFRSPSLYPPSYDHDVSFWLDGEREFDELEFHTLARAVSQDTVTSIRLLGRFQPPGSSRVSLCYRLTYQAWDRALSRQRAAAMQARLREEIGLHLHVKVR
ncbi:ferredoxin-fold anticodon-binding domain-containing protein 1 [Ornithorhynchus anatinus]|uniref:ferredoxin-fold anticodon-binding domain-containing protein 1 n=1 Tax=Ornithorhynchus anatinus TaxID=9258 RepID=UPI0019D4DB13|nr:ferredoxin-fold anticodon-binding domain-containing protein 1 [Ornithorhynchus anatinus]